ncbi:MAG: tetratricopeptide repeat protein [Planctomycetes bacterium]|nr:tetratricopeptide repeat protein [Planctomycetota bacterium]
MIGASEPSPRARAASLALVLLATAAAYAGVARHDFVPLDDSGYVYANAHVTSGLSLENLRWALTTGEEANWHPLTWLSLQLDVALFGVHAGASKLVNLALHLASTALLAALLHRWTRAWWPALFVAGVFALHPVHVESVAWVAERKDTLSHLFFVLALRAWTAFVESGRRRDQLVALLVFALGLLAKPMLVTFPFLLLVLEVWPLRSLRTNPRSVRALLADVAPFVALAAASSVVTFLVQRAGGAVVAGDGAGFGARAANAVVAYARYLGRAAWPSELSVLHASRACSPLPVAGSAPVLFLLAAWAWRGRARRPWRFVGLAWYVGTLVPVIGLVQVGYQSIAQRYTYVPLTGAVVALAYEIAALVSGRPRARRAVAALAIAALAACGWRTSVEVGYWRDGVVLFERALAIEPDNHPARRNLAYALERAGRREEARAEFERAGAVVRGDVEALQRLARAKEQSGDRAGALEALGAAVRLMPKNASVRYERAALLARMERRDEALAELEELLRRDASSADAHALSGRLALERGEFDRAADAYAEAARLRPDDPRAVRAALLSACEAGRADAVRARSADALDAEARAGLERALVRARARGESARADAIESLLRSAPR